MDAVEALNEFHKLPLEEQSRARAEFAAYLLAAEDEPEA